MRQNSLKIYCAGPIKGDTTFQKYYFSIIDIISKNTNHIPLSELNKNINLSTLAKNIYNRDIHWLNQSNLMIAEISGPSTGVGYEIAYALHIKKIPVLALYNINSKKISAMILYNTNKLLTLKQYSNMNDFKLNIINFIKDYENVSGY